MRRLVIALLVACSHEAPQTTPVAKAPSRCDQIADHVVSLMTAAQKADPVQLDPFRNVISKRCTDDHWSADAQQCLGAIQTLAEGDRCEKLLTPEQAQALERDGQAAASAVAPPAKPSKSQRTSDPCEGGE